MENYKKPCRSLDKLHTWELYAAQLMTEFRQCTDEGLDVAPYRDLFAAIHSMPLNENKVRMADVLFDIVRELPMREDYIYDEPSALEDILSARDTALWNGAGKVLPQDLRDRIAGAWYGRIIGCLLGKPVEGMRTNELIPLLKDSGNYPMHRYILSSDVTEEQRNTFRFKLAGRCFADTVDAAPVDDDTNYTVIYQLLVEKYGRNFMPRDVARFWLNMQSKNAYCTAERVAYRNFIDGYYPPDSAFYQNPYREWVGAQIRGDYFGYINPGDPAAAAAMSWRDACIAHVKNGIYGEMLIAAAIACAAVTDDIREILLGGLSQIPKTSRLYAAIMRVIEQYESGVAAEAFFTDLHSRWNEHDGHDWCHTISNAEIVAAALLYGQGDFGRSICMAVEVGFDTDCNGATVGSILGMRNGLRAMDPIWQEPLRGKLRTTIFGMELVEIDSLVETTMKHIADGV